MFGVTSVLNTTPRFANAAFIAELASSARKAACRTAGSAPTRPAVWLKTAPQEPICNACVVKV